MSGFEKRTAEKKKKVLEAAFHFMNSQEDFGSFSIAEVAELAGVSKTSIFKYFDSKENLIHQVFIDFLQRIGESAMALMEENLPFEETLIAMSQSKINYMDAINKQFFVKLMQYITEKGDDGLSLLMDQYMKQSVNIMLDVFHQGRKEGKIDLKYSDEFLMLYFQAMIEGISSPNVYEKIMPYTKEWTEILIKGIAPES